MAQLTATRSELLARRARISLLPSPPQANRSESDRALGHGRTAEGTAGVQPCAAATSKWPGSGRHPGVMGASAHSARAKAEGGCLDAGCTIRRNGARMLIAQRTAEVTWDGSLASGNGSVSSGSGRSRICPSPGRREPWLRRGRRAPRSSSRPRTQRASPMALALGARRGWNASPTTRDTCQVRPRGGSRRAAHHAGHDHGVGTHRFAWSRGVPGSGRCRKHALPCIECASRKRRSHRRGEAR